MDYMPPTVDIALTDAQVEYLLNRFDVDAETGCWPWTLKPDSEGYGRAFGTRRLAHRAVYAALVGPIPAGLCLDHLCRNRVCVNPDHLEVVTHRVNGLRGEGFAAVNASKDRCVHGHVFSQENTYRRPNGHRDCRRCLSDRALAYQRRKKENAA